MFTTSNYLYSRHAASAILNCPVDAVVSLQVWASVVWVKLRGCPPRFLSKKAFAAAFVSRRRLAGKDLQAAIKLDGNDFVVNGHRVEALEAVGLRYMRCDCEDFANQLKINPLGLRSSVACCKHCYAVLGHLGYASLAEYLSYKG